MQKDHALFHLAEAREAIESLLAEMRTSPEYDEANFAIDMQHIYWHINSAWNGRHFRPDQEDLTDGLYQSFIQYPADLQL